MRACLLICSICWLKVWLQEVAKQDALVLGEQLRCRANSIAEVLGDQLCQDASEVRFVLVINQAVMVYTHALM